MNVEKSDKISLKELFPKAARIFRSGTDLTPDDLDPKVAARIAIHLGLGFVQDQESEPGSVCLANDPEIRPEYKTVVTAQEVLAYIRAILQMDNSQIIQRQAPDSIPYPQHAEFFWQLVEKGFERLWG